MVQGCGNNCVKYAVIFVNVLVCIVGLAILATSLALVFSDTFQQYFVNVINDADPNAGGSFSSLKAVFYVTAAVGGLIFLTGFLGCCGAACESTCLLGIFFTIILLLFLTELGIGIAALVMKNSLQSDLTNFYNGTVVPDYINACTGTTPNAQLITSWNNTQNTLKCCGCMGMSDYAKAPKSAPNCQQYCYSGPNAPGCCNQLWTLLSENVVIVAGVAIGLLVVELLAMIFSCCMCSAIRNKYKHYA